MNEAEHLAARLRAQPRYRPTRPRPLVDTLGTLLIGILLGVILMAIAEVVAISV